MKSSLTTGGFTMDGCSERSATGHRNRGATFPTEPILMAAAEHSPSKAAVPTSTSRTPADGAEKPQTLLGTSQTIVLGS
jgi:hypothetical protein